MLDGELRKPGQISVGNLYAWSEVKDRQGAREQLTLSTAKLQRLSELAENQQKRGRKRKFGEIETDRDDAQEAVLATEQELSMNENVVDGEFFCESMSASTTSSLLARGPFRTDSLLDSSIRRR